MNAHGARIMGLQQKNTGFYRQNTQKQSIQVTQKGSKTTKNPIRMYCKQRQTTQIGSIAVQVTQFGSMQNTQNRSVRLRNLGACHFGDFYFFLHNYYENNSGGNPL